MSVINIQLRYVGRHLTLQYDIGARARAQDQALSGRARFSGSAVEGVGNDGDGGRPNGPQETGETMDQRAECFGQRRVFQMGVPAVVQLTMHHFLPLYSNPGGEVY